MGYVPFVVFIFWCRATAISFNLPAAGLTEANIDAFRDATYYRPECNCVHLTASTYGNQPTNSTGRIVYRKPIRFRDGPQLASFNTSFTFKIEQFLEGDPRFRPGAGLAFMIVPERYKESAESYGEYMGLVNQSMVDTPFFAVEFDDVQNADFNDPPYNHVGVDLNSLVSVSLFNITQGYSDLNLTSNFTLTAWVEYQAGPDLLEVRMSRNSSRPRNALIRTNFSSSKTKMSNALEDFMYVGFSAATGHHCFEFHKILAWNFSTYGISEHIKWTSTWRLPLVVTVLAVAGLGIVAALFFVWYRRQPDGNEDLLSELFNNAITRFSYKELKSATWGFSKRDLIGVGGFSKVYKGTLKDGSMVAVKVLDRRKASDTTTTTTSDGSHNTDHSLEQFANEMSTVGRLRHRNLVVLRGFCHERRKLMLVYEYMPRGSLDKLLFSSPSTLDWEQRLNIIKGVAEGLAFLHEGCERRVIHRDVKAANVLLDKDLNAKLGDFGFCKLMDHSSASQTMTAVGTRGYIAPELVYTGKATEKTDVYSYGVLLLEVVTGSRAVNWNKKEEDRVLLGWVWKMKEEDRLVEVIDSRLKLSGEAEVMAKRVLSLGLSCCHPEPASRPTMRRCCLFLEAGSSLSMEVPSTRPVAVFGSSSSISTPFLSTGSSEFTTSSEVLNPSSENVVQHCTH